MDKSITVAEGAAVRHFLAQGERAMGLENLIAVLGAKLVGRRVVPPIPPGAKARLGPADEPLPPAAEGEIVALPLALFIEYRGATGAISARRIACKRYEPANHTLLAFCFERQASRRFKVDRIVSAACPSSGEVFDLTSLVAGLRAGGITAVDDRLTRMLTILVFLMRCDRHVAAEEGEAIGQAAAAFALRFDGEEAMVTAGITQAMRIAPDGEDFVRALEWVARRADAVPLARLIRNHAQAVIVADGRIASEEAYFGGMVDDILGRIVEGERIDG